MRMAARMIGWQLVATAMNKYTYIPVLMLPMHPDIWLATVRAVTSVGI